MSKSPLPLPTRKIVCLYHANCADGFTAAWIVAKFFAYANGGKGVKLIPRVYGNPIADILSEVKDALVYIVDFSFPAGDLNELLEYANEIILIDHHKTAKEQLLDTWYSHPRLSLIFDMNRSGAGLVWDTLYPLELRPRLVDYVEDRDLFRFKHPYSKKAAEIIFSKEYTLDNWDLLEDMFEQESYEWLPRAEAILEYKEKSYKEMLDAGLFFIEIGVAGFSFRAVMCNLPYMWGSDACNYLCNKYGETVNFAAYYWDSEGYRTFGLRSIGDFDVSRIAKYFGGGGHKNAAGFRLSIKEGEVAVAEWKQAYLESEIP